MVDFFETRSYGQYGFTEEQRKYYEEHRLSQKGKHLWEQIDRLYIIARNLCSTYNVTYCFDKSCCCRRYKHLPFQCEYNDDVTISSYVRGNYDFMDVEQIEEFIAWKGAFEIAYLLESIDDAPYKYEVYSILEYCFDNYKDYNCFINNYLDRCSPPKEDECYIDECDDPIGSFEISLFDEIAACDTCTHDTLMSETCKNDFATENGIAIMCPIPLENDQSSCYKIVKSGFECFNPTIFELDKNYVFEDHENHALCDSYIVEFVHDATENYYERGKYGCRNFHVTKTPLYMLKVLKLLLFYLPVLVTLFFVNLFVYKIPMHRKWVRLKCVSHLLLDALFCFNSYYICEHH